jgi:hypothetical protein
MLMLPSDLSPKESYQMSALAERVVAYDSAVLNTTNLVSRDDSFSHTAPFSSFFLFKGCFTYTD